MLERLKEIAIRLNQKLDIYAYPSETMDRYLSTELEPLLRQKGFLGVNEEYLTEALGNFGDGTERVRIRIKKFKKGNGVLEKWLIVKKPEDGSIVIEEVKGERDGLVYIGDHYDWDESYFFN